MLEPELFAYPLPVEADDNLASIGLSALLSRPFTNMISEAIPGKRGVRDDAAEAVLKGATRAVAVIVASAVVRWLAGRRG